MSPSPPAELRERYREMLHAGALRPDPAQAMAVEKLQLLANRIARVGSSRVDLQACKLEYSIVSPK